jgi:hypothetical protein
VAALICAPALPALTRRITIYGWSTRPRATKDREFLGQPLGARRFAATGLAEPLAERRAAQAVAARDGDRSSPAPLQDRLPPGKIYLRRMTVMNQQVPGKTP